MKTTIIIFLLLIFSFAYANDYDECIKEEMSYWENITLNEAKKLCTFLINNQLEEDENEEDY